MADNKMNNVNFKLDYLSQHKMCKLIILQFYWLPFTEIVNLAGFKPTTLKFTFTNSYNMMSSLSIRIVIALNMLTIGYWYRPTRIIRQLSIL